MDTKDQIDQIDMDRAIATGCYLYIWPETNLPYETLVKYLLFLFEGISHTENNRYPESIGPELRIHLYSLEDGIPIKWLQDYSDNNYTRPFAIIMTVKDKNHATRFLKRSTEILEKEVRHAITNRLKFETSYSPFEQVSATLSDIFTGMEELKIIELPKRTPVKDAWNMLKSLKKKIPKITFE